MGGGVGLGLSCSLNVAEAVAVAVAGEAWRLSRQQMKDDPAGREALCRASGRYEPLVVLGHCTSLCADVDPLGCLLIHF